MARLVFTEKDQNAYDPKKYKVVHKNHWRQVSLRLAPTQKKWWEDPDVIVAEWVLPTNPAGGRCATVTMLLAQRIARNDCWSVDDEPRYRSNKMNVWQTLEYLSGLSLRKRYNYEGFADTQHLIRTLTPSFRRDSYADRTKAEEAAAAAAAASTTSGAGNVAGKYEDRRVVDSVADVVATAMARRRASLVFGDKLTLSVAAIAAPRRKRRYRKRRKQRNSPELDAEYALTVEDLQDLVKCT